MTEVRKWNGNNSTSTYKYSREEALKLSALLCTLLPLGLSSLGDVNDGLPTAMRLKSSADVDIVARKVLDVCVLRLHYYCCWSFCVSS